jgi:hypothetical protein
MELPFAGVHQLCAALPDRVEALPAPQRQALTTALGLVDGPVPERFFVGLAVLSLLSAVAAHRPVLCLVEDAQWLDGASSQVLGLVARRVRAESVAILVALREPADGHDFDGLPDLRLEGLREADAATLLASVVTGRLDSHVADRIVAETRGNPLALPELPARMTPTELAGFELPGAVELSAHIEGRMAPATCVYETRHPEPTRTAIFALTTLVPPPEPCAVGRWGAKSVLWTGLGALRTTEFHVAPSRTRAPSGGGVRSGCCGWGWAHCAPRSSTSHPPGVGQTPDRRDFAPCGDFADARPSVRTPQRLRSGPLAQPARRRRWPGHRHQGSDPGCSRARSGGGSANLVLWSQSHPEGP